MALRYRGGPHWVGDREGPQRRHHRRDPAVEGREIQEIDDGPDPRPAGPRRARLATRGGALRRAPALPCRGSASRRRAAPSRVGAAIRRVHAAATVGDGAAARRGATATALPPPLPPAPRPGRRRGRLRAGRPHGGGPRLDPAGLRGPHLHRRARDPPLHRRLGRDAGGRRHSPRRVDARTPLPPSLPPPPRPGRRRGRLRAGRPHGGGPHLGAGSPSWSSPSAAASG